MSRGLSFEHPHINAVEPAYDGLVLIVSFGKMLAPLATAK